jgi:hypothetical protein
MRNAKAQRTFIMGCGIAMQQAPEPHVRHADSGGSRETRTLRDYEGQRCALLTTKSRNTCTRATVFNSSG